MLVPWKKSYDQPRQHIKKQRHYFANKGTSSQDYGLTKSSMDMRVGIKTKLGTYELMLLNCDIGGDP